MTDLSIKNAVDERQCEMYGCLGCPYNVLGLEASACILKGGYRDLIQSFYVAELTGKNWDDLYKFIETEIKEPEGEIYKVAHPSEIRKLLGFLENLLHAAQMLTIGARGHYLRPEVVKSRIWLKNPRVKITPAPDFTALYDISAATREISNVVWFLKKALVIGKPVELGRYDFVWDAKDAERAELDLNPGAA